MMSENKLFKRRVRSFVRREGRITRRQTQALSQNWIKYGLERKAGLFNCVDVFGKEGPVVLEVGFGMGLSLYEQARVHPEIHFIGVEVYRPGIGNLFAKLAAAEMNNVRVYADDVLDVLTDCIPDDRLQCVQIFFPDPWPKKRHHKRRLIQPAFLALLHQKLVPEGELSLATDWQPYAEHMMEVIGAAKGWENPYGEGRYAPRASERALTKFEARGQRLGHKVWDIRVVKKGGQASK